jgi:hypothetical protein
VRFSIAHGGKDGRPFPLPLRTYDESLAVLRRSLAVARFQQSKKIEGFRRLDRLTRAVEVKFEPLAEFSAALSRERAISKELGCRRVFDGKRHGRPKVPRNSSCSGFQSHAS